ncbi:MAG: Crp/Fnr family transcriptional regulator [Bacteroidales bacterium]|nr:Crp/Fnr family transcriptional regulator [Bacteroidales bacterium]
MKERVIQKDLTWCQQCLFIKQSALFLNEKQISTLEKNIYQLQFRPGETIFKQGDTTTHIALLNKGIVKFNFDDGHNRNLILSIVSAPKILGGANMFYRKRNLFSISAIDYCDICLIDQAILRDLLLENAKYTLMLFEKAMEMFDTAILNYISLANKNVKGRVADILIYLSDNVYKSQSFRVHLTRKEIAEFAGCSKENVMHTLAQWTRENIIHCEGKRLEILDMERLLKISRIG